MKVFSLNCKSAFEFWGAFTPAMFERFCRADNPEAEWIGIACEAMLGTTGSSYLENEYAWFVSPDTDESDKIDLLGAFIGGCIKNAGKNKKKTLSLVDMTEFGDMEDKSYCVSDTVLRDNAEDIYDPIISEATFKQVAEELDDTRDYLISAEGVDIYSLLLHISDIRLGVSHLKKEAVERMRAVIAEYSLTDLLTSALELDGMVDYITARIGA